MEVVYGKSLLTLLWKLIHIAGQLSVNFMLGSLIFFILSKIRVLLARIQ
jgi:hypothetical protein